MNAPVATQKLSPSSTDITRHLAEPIYNPGEPNAFYGHALRVWIDAESGQQIKIQVFWRLADGTEQTTFAQGRLLVEKILTPPEEILEILDNVVMP